eukprot:SAG31_NODE_678_length_12892_cov_5.458063_9_plen_249_part_00
MVKQGGITGIFLDGFQGCDPFFPRYAGGHKTMSTASLSGQWSDTDSLRLGWCIRLKNGSFGVGCTRICGHRKLPNGTTVSVKCSTASIAAWNKGLREAMWRLKKLLGKNGNRSCVHGLTAVYSSLNSSCGAGTLICNSTPGPYTCGNAANPATECPCDGTNDERGGGNFEHMQFVTNAGLRDGTPYVMLTHTPHADDIANFKHSVCTHKCICSSADLLIMRCDRSGGQFSGGCIRLSVSWFWVCLRLR